MPVHLFQFDIYIYIYIYIYFFFFQIWNSDADVKLGLFNCPPSRVSLHAHFFFCSDSTKLTVFIGLVTVILSLNTFNLSMGPTAIPIIRVPRVRTDLAT